MNAGIPPLGEPSGPACQARSPVAQHCGPLAVRPGILCGDPRCSTQSFAVTCRRSTISKQATINNAGRIAQCQKSPVSKAKPYHHSHACMPAGSKADGIKLLLERTKSPSCGVRHAWLTDKTPLHDDLWQRVKCNSISLRFYSVYLLCVVRTLKDCAMYLKYQ